MRSGQLEELVVAEYDKEGNELDVHLWPVSEDAKEVINALRVEVDVGGQYFYAAAQVTDGSSGFVRVAAFRRERARFKLSGIFDTAPLGGFDNSPTVLPESSGGISLVWDSNPDNEFGGGDVTALRLSPTLEGLSNRIKLDESLVLRRPQATMLSSHRGIALWWTPDGVPGCELRARFFSLPQLIFADGFESGSTGAWSTLVD